MKNKMTVMAAMLVLGLSGCAREQPSETTETPAASPDTPSVGVHKSGGPSAAVLAKGDDPKAPEGAEQAMSIGEGTLLVTADDAADDYVWTEEIDVDEDGTVEETDLLYDDEDKVLYMYAEADFACGEGEGSAAGRMLTAIYDDENPAGKPAGSGWYAMELDEGECYAEAAALWGCRFDESGTETECGIVTVQADADEIVIVEAES